MLTRMIFTVITLLSLALSAGAPILPAIPAQPGSHVRDFHVQSSPEGFDVAFYPVAPYHIGDVLSVRVTGTGSGQIEGQEISIALANDPGNNLGTETFSQRSRQATFYWFLDTAGYETGFLEFIFTITETGLEWRSGINLLPAPPNRDSEWVSVRTNCCTIHYPTGSDAATDISKVQEILETQTAEAISQFFPGDMPEDNPLEDPLELVLIPIVVGHGGFATDVAVMTYSERNWAGINLAQLSHHEVVHVLDRQLNDGARPSLFVEGIAVYLSDGHYRPGDPLMRAAALVEMGMYLPITSFVNDFYNAQHEIGYMEGAAFVAYLTEKWGWETFLDFYFNLEEGENDYDTISSALQRQYGMDLDALETEFVNHLETLNPDDQVKSDVRLTVETYDMIRRYQTLAIPSAHFQTAWWPPIGRMIESGIIGDYAWREKSPFNVMVENLFLEIHDGLDDGNLQVVENNLNTIGQILDEVADKNIPPSHYAIGWPLHKLPVLPLRP